jgi:signal transduction histidine kinase
VAYAGGDAPALLQYFGLYFGYWVQWAIAAPLVYSVLASFSVPTLSARWSAGVAVHALILLALIATANLYFHTWNSFAAHTETFGATGYWRRLGQSGALLVSVHIFKYSALILICMLIRQHRLRQIEEDRRVAAELSNRQLAHELANARLATLKGQLHPHFLFNALNCIAGLIEMQRNADAYAAVADLAALLRKTLDAAQHERVPLQEDLDLARSYLRIAKLRFGDRISWDIAVDDDVVQALAPPLLLQPLVENAVKHAVEKSDRPIHIDIRAHRVGSSVHLSVSDNGTGFSGAGLPEGVGVGLSNLRGRLGLLYGDRGELEVGEATPGARVQIAFPFEYRPS